MKNKKLSTPDEKPQDLVIRIKPSTLLTVILVSVGLLLAYAQGRASYHESTSTPSLKPLLSVSPTPSPSPKAGTEISAPNYTTTKNSNPNITCTGPDGKQFQTTQTECDNFNSAWGNKSSPTPNTNEVVKCLINANCGGGYKEMTMSACDQSICCKVSDNNWQLRTKSECTNQQQSDRISDCTSSCFKMWTTNHCYSKTDSLSCINEVYDGRDACIDSCYK